MFLHQANEKEKIENLFQSSYIQQLNTIIQQEFADGNGLFVTFFSDTPLIMWGYRTSEDVNRHN